jgi:hypothetical protein
MTASHISRDRTIEITEDNGDVAVRIAVAEVVPGQGNYEHTRHFVTVGRYVHERFPSGLTRPVCRHGLGFSGTPLEHRGDLLTAIKTHAR